MHQKLYFCLVFLKTLVETNKNLLLTARCLVFFSRWFVIAKIVLNSFCSHLHLGVLFRHWRKPENRNEFLEAVMFLWKGERKSFFTSFLRPVTNCPLIPIYANKSLVLPRPDKQNDYWFPTCLFFMRDKTQAFSCSCVCAHHKLCPGRSRAPVAGRVGRQKDLTGMKRTGKFSCDGWGAMAHHKRWGKVNPVISNTWQDEPPTV